MANYVNKGFWPVAADRWEPRPYTVASGYDPANNCVGIAPGEVVKGVAAGTLEIADAADALIIGVVHSVRYKDSNGNIITGGYLPEGHTYTGDASINNPNAPIIMVYDQPNIEYIASMAGSATTEALIAAMNFGAMDLSATSSTTVDTVYRRSLRTLSGTLVAGAAQFKILETFRQPGHEYTSTNWRARVMINEGNEGIHPLHLIGGL
jgi:hypothetical protein